MIIIEVQDTGVGMSDHSQKTLFSEYDKSETFQELNQKGIGLGLSICKKLTEGMGGKISVSSKQGVGSIFKFQVEVKDWKNMDSPVVFPSSPSKTKKIKMQRSQTEKRIIKKTRSERGSSKDQNQQVIR